MGVGSEGTPGVLVFLLAKGFLATAVEGEGSVAGEGGRTVDVDGGSCTRVFHELMFCRLRDWAHLRSSRGGYHS